MIVEIHFTGFRGQTASYQFGKVNRIIGRNGAGKSSVKEAISFLFGGTDSAGNRAPVHLISTGSDQCTVRGRTGKVELERTLTRKKNGGLWMTRAGVRTPLSQSQLEELLGATSDLFLSVFVAGYFADLPRQRKMAVMAEVLPKVDRRALLEQILTFPIEAHEATRYDLTKRADLVSNQVAGDRREIQRRLDVNCGRLDVLAGPSAALDRPTEPAELQLLAHFERLSQAWRDYQTRVEAASAYEAQASGAQAENERRAARRKQLQGEMAEIESTMASSVAPTRADYEPQLAALRKEYQHVPPSPEQMKIVDGDHCPSCGQTVGTKHKERVRAENQKRKEEWEREKEKAEKHNAELGKRLQELEVTRAAAQKSYDEALSALNRLRARKTAIESELRALADMPMPPAPPQPVPPTEAYDAAEHDRAKAVADEYKKRLAQYEHVQREQASKATEIQRLEAENVGFSATVSRLQALEHAIKELPQAELAYQTEALAMPGYKVVLADDDVMIVDAETGHPYTVLSTGQRMKGDINVCLMFNRLMRRPLGIVFLDNADLVDDLPTDIPVQIFFAEVDAAVKGVSVLTEGAAG